MNGSVINRIVCIVVLLTVSAVFPDAKKKTVADMRKVRLSFIERGALSMQTPIPVMAKKEVQGGNGRYLSYVEMTGTMDGTTWEDFGVMRLTYDAQGRIGALVQTDGDYYEEHVLFEYKDAGNTIVESDTMIDASVTPVDRELLKTTTYLGTGTTYNSTFDHMNHFDILNLDVPEVQTVDSMLIDDLYWDATDNSWGFNYAEKLTARYQSEYFTVTTTELDEDGSGYVSSVEKYVPAFTTAGKVDSIVCYSSDGESGDFVRTGCIRHTYDGTGRLVSIAESRSDDDGMESTTISLMYNGDGVLSQYLFEYVYDDMGTVRTVSEKLVFHYADAPNAPVKTAAAPVRHSGVAARFAGAAVIVSSPGEERIVDVRMYDLAGRETARFDAAADGFTGVHTCSVPLPARSGAQLLRIRTDRSAVTIKLNGGLYRQ